MKKIINYPKVILVGRTNVGKSTIFNRLSSKTSSIVLEEEGVTRDYLSEIIEWNNKKFELIDTGGISLKKQSNPILKEVRNKVLKLLEKSALILFVCDGKNGLTQEDILISKTLHKTKRPLVLLINKSDNINALEENLPEFYKLGIKEIIPISAIHGVGFLDILEQINLIIPNPTIKVKEENPSYNIVIIGKPNVGKSSLMNLLTKEERSIVTSKAGTTREAISKNIYFSQDLVKITDTAGMRKKAKVSEDLETLMVKSSLSSIRQADIVILMIDASELRLSDQELKLLFYANEQNKAVYLIINKTDLIDEQKRKILEHNLKEYSFILKKIPITFISCKNKKNIEKIYKEIEKIRTRCTQDFDNVKINELIKNQLLKKPMYHKTILLIVKKITTEKNSNFPIFNLKVNRPNWFGPTQLGFIENILRKHYDLKGCPIKFNIKR